MKIIAHPKLNNPPSSAGWNRIRLLTANVGNNNIRNHGRYNYKLCNLEIEDKISEGIRLIKPDIVFLQEALHPDQCKGWNESDPRKSCFKNVRIINEYQPRRLLGNDYSIVCASRKPKNGTHCIGMECIAVNINAGQIEGCKPQDLRVDVGQLDQVKNGCDPDFVVHSATANLKGIKVQLINVHPHSRNKKCRNSAIRGIFEGENDTPALIKEKYVIIAGDFNFDPIRDNDDLIDFWNRNIKTQYTGSSFYNHSGLAEHKPPYLTIRNFFQKRTVDHILSNFAIGTCITIGEAPGTSRLDGGRGMDHNALVGELWIPPP